MRFREQVVHDAWLTPLSLLLSVHIQFVVGDEYTIADMAIWPWVEGLQRFYTGSQEYFNNFEEWPNVRAWIDRIGSRPATQRAWNVTPISQS